MNYKSFIITTLGMTSLGVSIGYVLGYYTHKHALNNYWFYLSVPIFIFASLLIIYGSLFFKDNK
tara:strand:+ start:136 stop:327 length:192 start_codon:yes stop_codon:yes gene_type:complete